MDGLLIGQLLANGVMVGAGYALAAVGLTIILGILNQVNFAHGELYMLAAFAMYLATSALGLPYEAGFVVVLVVMAGIGWLLAHVAILPNLQRSFASTILATLAVSIIAQNTVRLVMGATPRDIAAPYEFASFDVLGVLIFGQRAVILLLAAATIGALHLFLRFTAVGLTMRAVAQNREACLMVGIDVRRVATWSVVWGAILAGVAGASMGPLYDLYPHMGVDIVIKSFAVVIMGGMGNVTGAVIAGLALGTAESFADGLATAAVGDAIFFVVMILVLLVRPHGLFGRVVRI